MLVPSLAGARPLSVLQKRPEKGSESYPIPKSWRLSNTVIG